MSRTSGIDKQTNKRISLLEGKVTYNHYFARVLKDEQPMSPRAAGWQANWQIDLGGNPTLIPIINSCDCLETSRTLQQAGKSAH